MVSAGLGEGDSGIPSSLDGGTGDGWWPHPRLIARRVALPCDSVHMDTPTSVQPPMPSRLARMQQCLFFVWMAATLGWLIWRVEHSLALAMAGLAVLLGGHALVLALELLCMRVVSKADPAPSPSAAELFHAWRDEAWQALRVFAWHQPWRWRTLPDPLAATKGARGVVLVHGFVCNRGFWLPWLERLAGNRIPYVTVNLEPVFGGIDDYVPLIEAAVQQAWARTGQAPMLVGHSMGGLAIRAWLASSADQRARVGDVVTMGSPHHGTWLAQWSHARNGQQMRVGGPWLRALAARERQLRPQGTYDGFTCWYSNTDNIVFPVSTATLPGADNRLIRGAPHVGLAFVPEVLDDLLARLRAAGAP